MPLTCLDPVTALIVIDLQNGIVALPTAHPPAGIVEKANQLTAAFRRHHLPVVLVNVAAAPPGRTEKPRHDGPLPDDWADLVAELHRTDTDHLVTKRSWGAFTGTGLEEYLRARSVTQVVVIGIATAIGVESTARQAHELGFNVTLATDAMTDLSADTHHNSITRMFPRLGETGSTADLIALLDKTHS